MQAISLNWIASCIAVLALITASCAPSTTPASAPKAPPAETATSRSAIGTSAPSLTPGSGGEQPKYGGVFTSSITANPPSLDAHQESATNTSLIVSPIYSNLVQLDPLTGDKFMPGLATKWEMSQDGLNWTFDMRDGVRFHEGTPFTVDDAVFTLKRLTDPPKGIRSQLSFLLRPVVASIDKVGNQVKIKLKDPFPVMLELMAHNFGPVYSQKYVEKQGDMTTTAMGTGPFKLKSYTPGVNLEGVKNPDFWVKGRPYLDGYRFLVIKDVATHLSAFRTGKLNTTGKGFATLTPTEMDTVKKENTDLKFYPSATLVGPFVSLNWQRSPFKDQRVRKAVFLALDRQAALRVLAQGQGIIGRPFPAAPWGIPNEELMQKPGYRQPKDADIAQAKKLLADAGYPEGFDLTVLARPMWQAKDPAVFMTSQLAQIGIKAKVNALEDAVVQDLARRGDFDAFFYTPFWSLSDPTWQGRFWAPGGGANYSRNDEDKELASLMDQQAKILDPTQRNVVIRKVEERLLDALPGIPVVWLRSYIGVRPELKNFSPGNDYLGNTLEEIWLTK